jgi:hypothetical protein
MELPRLVADNPEKELGTERGLYDHQDVCWTTRLYFHPLSMKLLLLYFSKKFKEFHTENLQLEIPPTDPCVSGSILLPSPKEIILSIARAVKTNCVVAIQLWVLYMFIYFPPARYTLSRTMNPVLLFLAEPFLRVRLCILFSSPAQKGRQTQRLEEWMEATLQPMVRRAHHLLFLSTHGSHNDHVFIRQTTDYGDEDQLSPELDKWRPKTYEEWASFKLPQGFSPLLAKEDMLRKIQKLYFGDVASRNLSAWTLSLSDIVRSTPMVILLQIGMLSHSFASKRDGIKRRYRKIKSQINIGMMDEDNLMELVEENDEDEDEEEEEADEDHPDVPARIRKPGWEKRKKEREDERIREQMMIEAREDEDEQMKIIERWNSMG